MAISKLCHTLLKHLKKYLLCLYENLVIITYPGKHKLLNKWSEPFCKCLHDNKYIFKNSGVNEKGKLNILPEGKTLTDLMKVYLQNHHMRNEKNYFTW